MQSCGRLRTRCLPRRLPGWIVKLHWSAVLRLYKIVTPTRTNKHVTCQLLRGIRGCQALWAIFCVSRPARVIATRALRSCLENRQNPPRQMPVKSACQPLASSLLDFVRTAAVNADLAGISLRNLHQVCQHTTLGSVKIPIQTSIPSLVCSGSTGCQSRVKIALLEQAES